MSQALNTSEDWEEDRWVVSYIGRSFVIASVNGQITHGDRLRLRLDFEDCDNVHLITSVYTMKGNQDILDMAEEEISVAVDGNEFVGTIDHPRKFLMGHSFLLYLGYNGITVIKSYFSESKSFTLQLLDSDEIKISDYVDLDRNEWSLDGFNGALEKAQATCKAGKKIEL
ncbi:hypothetical protein N9P30_02340 [Alphaproteobacteria bacterium]|nr:hypothetical protein [Alphaproteobacteria bacterium]